MFNMTEEVLHEENVTSIWKSHRDSGLWNAG